MCAQRSASYSVQSILSVLNINAMSNCGVSHQRRRRRKKKQTRQVKASCEGSEVTRFGGHISRVNSEKGNGLPQSNRSERCREQFETQNKSSSDLEDEVSDGISVHRRSVSVRLAVTGTAEQQTAERPAVTGVGVGIQ